MKEKTNDNQIKNEEVKVKKVKKHLKGKDGKVKITFESVLSRTVLALIIMFVIIYWLLSLKYKNVSQTSAASIRDVTYVKQIS